MTSETVIDNKFAFSFKKNNIDEMFHNLTENPVGCEKKDFQYTAYFILFLSLVVCFIYCTNKVHTPIH